MPPIHAELESIAQLDRIKYVNDQVTEFAMTCNVDYERNPIPPRKANKEASTHTETERERERHIYQTDTSTPTRFLIYSQRIIAVIYLLPNNRNLVEKCQARKQHES